MNEMMETKSDRREFFRSALRAIVLGATAAGTAVFAKNAIKHGKISHVCENKAGCGGCPVISDCILPQAMTARNVLKGGKAAKSL